MPDTPADTLRAAAQHIREHAAAAQHSVNTDRYWADYAPSTAWRDGVTNGFGGTTSPYISLMHPGVGELIAAWLESAARTWEFVTYSNRDASLAVARAVLDSRDS